MSWRGGGFGADPRGDAPAPVPGLDLALAGVSFPSDGPWGGAEGAPMLGRAIWFDGQVPVPQGVILRCEGDDLLILTGDAVHRWPLAGIREQRDMSCPDMAMLHNEKGGAERLLVHSWEVAHGLLPHCPNLTHARPVSSLPRLMGWAVAAIAAVALILLVMVPLMADRLAPMIPPEGERALGERTLSHLHHALEQEAGRGIAFCTAPEGQAVLQRMQAMLSEQAVLPYPVTVRVLDHPMVNAIALPGGQIVLYEGLIRTAGSAEEIAAVLAHEIGHVVSRDPTRDALRSAGSIGVLGLVFGDFAGGTVSLLLANRLIDARYSQTAELAADEFARDLLRKADLPEQALSGMFDRMAHLGGEPPALLRHLDSHPRLADRIAGSGAGAEDQAAAQFSAEEWQALRRICR